MSLLALVILLAQNLGLGKAYPWALLPLDLGRWVWVGVSLGVVVLLAEQAGLVRLGRTWRSVAARAERVMGQRAALLALLAGSALFAVVSTNHYARFGYGWPWLHLALLAAAAPFVRRDRFWLSCAVSLGLLVASIVHFPLTVERSAALPGLALAWDHLATGKSPYALLTLGRARAWTLPDLPGMFFSHGPAWVLGLDLRWNQLLWRLLWMLGLGIALERLPADSPWRTVAFVFVLNPYFGFRHDLQGEAFLAGIAAYQALPRWRWLSLPALAWIHPWAWVLAPFLALDWLLSPGQTPRGQSPHSGPGAPRLAGRAFARQAGGLALGTLLVSGALGLALAPTTAGATFLRAVFPTGEPLRFDYGLTLGPLADKFGAGDMLPYVQWVAVAALALLALWRRWREPDGRSATEGVERLGLVALCVFVLLNPGFEVSDWLEPGFWILAAYTFGEAGAAGLTRRNAALGKPAAKRV